MNIHSSDTVVDIVINSDCLTYMKSIADNVIDLVVTSPPYAKQRASTYGGINAKDFPEWFITISKELHRILKPTGSFVLNIKEHARNGTRHPYVLKTVLQLSELFIWNDTYIWNKSNPFPTGNKRRLKDGFEYCYLFTKTLKYKFFPDNVLVPSISKNLKYEKQRNNKSRIDMKNNSGMNMHRRYASDFVRPSNVLTLATDNTSHKHPATFPIGLPEFFIKLLTEPEDVVYDPFMGSGTTLLAAKNLNRHFIGTDIFNEYVLDAKQRLALS